MLAFEIQLGPKLVYGIPKPGGLVLALFEVALQSLDPPKSLFEGGVFAGDFLPGLPVVGFHLALFLLEHASEALYLGLAAFDLAFQPRCPAVLALTPAPACAFLLLEGA
jgi:hypothetical protein